MLPNGLRAADSAVTRFGFAAASDRDGLDSHEPQIEVELGAMVNLVLLHVIQNPMERAPPLLCWTSDPLE